MNQSRFQMNIFQSLLVIGMMLTFGLACQLMRDSKYDDKPTPRRTPTTESTRSESPTPSVSPSASTSPASNSNNVTMSTSYQDNLPSGFKVPGDSVGRRIMSDYGAVYVARGVTPPPTVMFSSGDECVKWQSSLKTTRGQVGGVSIELQEAAMKDLQAAETEAQGAGVKITPNGPDASRRSYDDTVRLWASRVNPNLDFWVKAGKVSKDDAARIKGMSPTAQVPEILKLEDQGIFFSLDRKKSILYSVAAPGASQHLSMLALDVAEHTDTKVREIMARHNWYQTVSSDLPHFTYLGAPTADLPKLGLKSVTNDGRTFWVPAL